MSDQSTPKPRRKARERVGRNARPIVRYVRIPINDCLEQALGEIRWRNGGLGGYYLRDGAYLAFVLEEAIYAMAAVKEETGTDVSMPFFNYVYRRGPRRGLEREETLNAINAAIDAASTLVVGSGGISE